jgi:hypothetical protein
VPKGGDDQCEDVFSGLEAAAKLSWNTAPGSARSLYHIADAPCHGRRFHSGAGDYHPGGDALGRSIGSLLSKLRVDLAIAPYTFAHINGSTRKMLEEFRKEASGLDWIIEEDLGTDTTKLTKMVRPRKKNAEQFPVELWSLATTEKAGKVCSENFDFWGYNKNSSI